MPVIAASSSKKLVEQPAMRMVLADLALEVEAMTALALRLARSFDRERTDEHEAAYARARDARRQVRRLQGGARACIYESMECLGGNGYVEESPLPRLYREAPVNAIWEGSGNVMALDVLRAESREPEDAAAVLRAPDGRDVRDLPGASEAARDIVLALQAPEAEARARFVAERLATLPPQPRSPAPRRPEIAEAYARTRLPPARHDRRQRSRGRP